MISSTQTNHPLVACIATKNDGANNRDDISVILREAGLRSTQPRVAIYKVLQELNEPASNEGIHRNIKVTNCDLVTVYRCLSLFEEMGLVHRSFDSNGTSLYQLKRAGQVQYYVSCKHTNRRMAIDPSDAEDLKSIITRIEGKLCNSGFKNLTHRVEFEGCSVDGVSVPNRVTGESRIMFDAALNS